MVGFDKLPAGMISFISSKFLENIIIFHFLLHLLFVKTGQNAIVAVMSYSGYDIEVRVAFSLLMFPNRGSAHWLVMLHCNGAMSHRLPHNA